MPPGHYVGHSLQTRREPFVDRCVCGEPFRVEAGRAVESSDASLVARLKEGALNRFTCPACSKPCHVEVPITFHDLDGPRLFLILPDALRHRELDERAALLLAL